MTNRITRRSINTGIGAALISPALVRTPAFAEAEPIKIGFSMAQTGGLVEWRAAPYSATSYQKMIC